jgi:hypothetical protein
MSGQLKRINTCANCIFSHLENGQLWCRKAPPQVSPVFIAGQDSDTKKWAYHVIDWISAWPPVNPDQFCGEHKTNAIVRATELPRTA